jgi:hypothetical protein
MSALVIAALAAQAAAGADTGMKPESTVERNAGQISYIDIEGAAGYSTNPLLSVTSDSSRAYGRIDLHAVHTRVSERSTTVLSGFASNTTYTSKYGSQQSVAVDARHDTAVSEQFRLFMSANASYDEDGQLDTRVLSIPVVPPLPGAPPIPPGLTPGQSDFLSVRGRHYLASGDLGGSLALSAIDHLHFDAGARYSKFKSAALFDTQYTSIHGSAGYDRQLSARATVGAQVSAENTDYNGPTSIRVVTPQLTTTLQLSETLVFTGAGGVTFASTDNGIDTRHSTGLAAQASLCSITGAGSLCAHAEADQQTATTAGPAKTISGGINFSRRLGPASTIDLSLDASHYSQPTSVFTGRTLSSSDYIRAAASYAHNFGRRWFGGVNLSGRKVTQNGPDPKADFDASVFIRYRFGNIQ